MGNRTEKPVKSKVGGKLFVMEKVGGTWQVFLFGDFTAFNHFRDEDIRDRCENQCETDFVDCTLPCDDTNCLLECGRILTECVNGTFSLYFQITNTVYTIRYESWTKTFNLIYFKIAHVTPIARMDVLIAQIYFVSVETILHHKTKIIWRRAKMRKALI